MNKNHAFIFLSGIAAISPRADAQDESLSTGPAHVSVMQEAATVTIETLRNREEYQGITESEAESLAHQARRRWSVEFVTFTYLEVEQFSVGEVKHWISLWSHNKTGLEFALVPGGRFQMGSHSSEPNRKEDEWQHWVSLDPFLIALTECTQDAWAKLAGDLNLGGATFKGSGQLPKAGMSPGDVDAWCRGAGLMTPTEAQWEYMCRAGTTSPWAMGSERTDLKKFGNVGSAECPDGWKKMPGITEDWNDGFGAEAAPVGSFAPNAFGLFDVHGNVSEWTRDGYFSYGVPAELGSGARVGDSSERIAKGGNFGGDASFARVALRPKFGSGISPGANHGFGFRPALDLPLPITFEGWPEETFPLPPGFAQELPKGTESLRFCPGWRMPDSEEFWSYAFIMWIEEPTPNAKRVEEILDDYYDGLMLVFAGSAGKDIGADPAEVTVKQVTPSRFEAEMYTPDAFATFRDIDVRVVVDVFDEGEGKSRLHVRLSLQPAEHGVWRALEAATAEIERP